MSNGSSFLVEEFIQSITAQLDRVQDALRVKALNRPLTYALKDISLDLNVFVEVDEQGHVRFRTSQPNETGASIVKLGFTTITRPMIEENTVSLTMTQSPSLDELGLEQLERHKLEQLGVRNAAQLQQLQASTGARTVSRLSGVPIDRLLEAIRLGRPLVREVTPVRPEPRPPRPEPRPPRPTPPRLPVHPEPPTRPEVRPDVIVSRPGRSVRQPAPPRRVRPGPASDQREPGRRRVEDQIRTRPERTAPPVIRLTPQTRRLRLAGANLLGPNGPPVARLGGVELTLDGVREDELIIHLPEDRQDGRLEIELFDGEQLAYDLSTVPDDHTTTNGDRPLEEDGNGFVHDTRDDQARDPWTPEEGEW